jgi:hypothetical protein
VGKQPFGLRGGVSEGEAVSLIDNYPEEYARGYEDAIAGKPSKPSKSSVDEWRAYLLGFEEGSDDKDYQDSEREKEQQNGT